MTEKTFTVGRKDSEWMRSRQRTREGRRRREKRKDERGGRWQVSSKWRGEECEMTRGGKQKVGGHNS